VVLIPPGTSRTSAVRAATVEDDLLHIFKFLIKSVDIVIECLSRPLIAAANVSACVVVAPNVYDSIIAGRRMSHEFGKFSV